MTHNMLEVPKRIYNVFPIFIKISVFTYQIEAGYGTHLWSAWILDILWLTVNRMSTLNNVVQVQVMMERRPLPHGL